MNVVAASVFSFPVAALIALNFALIVGGGEFGGMFGLTVFLAAWPLVTFYASRTYPVSRVVGRTAVIYTIAAFGLPVSALIFMFVAGGQIIGDEPSEAARAGAVIGVGMAGTVIVGIAAVFGFFTGIISLVIAWMTLREQNSQALGPPQSKVPQSPHSPIASSESVPPDQTFTYSVVHGQTIQGREADQSRVNLVWCHACGASNGTGIKFCTSCGTALESLGCESCGNSNPVDYIYCTNCGAELGPSSVSQPARNQPENSLAVANPEQNASSASTAHTADVPDSLGSLTFGHPTAGEHTPRDDAVLQRIDGENASRSIESRPLYSADGPLLKGKWDKWIIGVSIAGVMFICIVVALIEATG